MIIKEIKNWTHGIVDNIEPESIPVGSFSRALNMLTMGDHFELRRGSRILGADAGAGSVGGLGVGTKLDSDGTQIMFRKVKGNQKIEYYDADTELWAETGTNAVPTAAINDDFAFTTYQSQAGSQGFFSSPLSSIYKIMIANPASVTDLLSTVYRGYIKIKQSRTFLWNRNAASGSGRRDEQNIYNSYIDAQAYTTVTAEVLADVAAGTLAFKGGGSKRTCFGVAITHTASGEVFSDNRDGTLSGSLGGTGTINYTTGAFTTSASGAGTADYQWEDSTNTGVADFSFSGTRTEGQGNVFLQGDGGPVAGVESYGDVEYCAHKYKIYGLTLTADDTGATNLIFRDREGIPNWRAFKGTSQGIFYVNAIDETDPKIKVLTLQQGSTAIDGVEISQALNLSGYRFDRCEINEFGDYITISCRTEDSVSNNRFILYHKTWKSFDIVDYWGLVSTVYYGAFHVGESITGNVVEVFSGVDDDGAAVDGFAELNDWDLEYAGYLKKCKKIQIEGNIGPDQVFDVQASIDRGAFVTIGQIKGSGDYVDRTQSVDVGSQTLGRGEVAGGSSPSSDGITAYHYFRELRLTVDKFERIKIRFAHAIDDETDQEGIGYFSVSTLRFYDVRLKNQKLPRKYRGTA